jgi:2-polyprenyl-3-methyl-5-hydroxy-6-metoxy-1,4-benzoquinol methylase
MIKFDVKCFFVNRDQYICNLSNGKSVLHLGCTDSPYHESAHNKNRLLHLKLINIASNLKGIDFSINGIQYLKSINSRLDLEFADITNVSIINTSNMHFDVLLFSDVIEHLSNPGLALNNISKLMNKSTILIITTPNSFSIKSFLRVIFRKELVHEDHTCYYSFPTLVKSLEIYSINVIKKFSYVGGGSSLLSKLIKPLFYLFPWLADGIGVVAVLNQSNNKFLLDK